MIEIIPTVVPSGEGDIERAASMYRGFAPVLHVDFADGLFAPNTTWIPSEAKHDMSHMGVKLEAHLMVQEPRDIGISLLQAGFERVIGHVEAMSDVAGTLESWRREGAQEVGLGILATTQIEAIGNYVDAVDMVQMMTISKIGVQGLPFDEHAPDRVRLLHEMHPKLLISVDGGVNETTIAPLAKSGARRFCAGSVLSKAANPKTVYNRLITLAESGTRPAL